VLFVITDGLSIDNVLSPIQQLVAMKVDVFAIGVGNSVRKAQHQLLTIAKNPQHLYLIDFENLVSLVTRLSKKTCYGKFSIFMNRSSKRILEPWENTRHYMAC